jgi:tetratricopeptide (TPR) repeat protein
VNPTTIGPTTGEDSSLERRVFLILACLALIYAFLAGLRTVADLDTGWQMATGRWVVQHHQVPSADVLSYTAQGEHWLYPVGAGVVFYLAFLLGGYALLSWMSAAACAGTVALLLRRGSAASAAIAILAVPLIAERTPPRADMFTVVLFAAFLSILWENYQTGRAPLWLLPLLMVVWVNVHFGFAAGLGLIVAYVGTEVLEFVFGAVRRQAALQRLRRASFWFVGTAAATLVNPWGWGIYRSLLLQQRASSEQQTWIAEWRGVRLNWHTAGAAFTLGGLRSALFSLLAIAVVAGLVALVRGQLGAAILLFAAAYAPVRHIRMGAVFACVVVVIGGENLSAGIARVSSWIRLPRLRAALAGVAVMLLAMLTYARSADLVTDRHYFGASTDLATFGTGLSWWFPRRAAEFIERENLPGEIFNTYDEGGYVAWRLGPQRLDYIDGRDTLFGLPRVERERLLLQSSPDLAIWDEETNRYHINTVLLSRGDGIDHGQLRAFCASSTWRPVYLDEVSAVFVRRTPQTEALIQRFPVNCATAPLPAETEFGSRAEEFAAWVNAAGVLAVLGRNLDSMEASDKAIAVFPGCASAHLARAGALTGMNRGVEAEKELMTAIALSPSEYTWSDLAKFYIREGRASDAIPAIRKAVELQADPQETLVQLGYFALNSGHPDDALEAFDEALRSASASEKKSTGRDSFAYKVATGKAEALSKIGDPKQAVLFQEQAVELAPNVRQSWLNLADIYQSQGRSADAERAKARAASITEDESR